MRLYREEREREGEVESGGGGREEREEGVSDRSTVCTCMSLHG